MEHLPWTVVHGNTVWVIFLVVVMVVFGLLGWLRPVLKIRRAADKRRAVLGTPAGSIDPDKAGSVVVLQGRLKGWDEPARRFENDKPTAVTTIAPSSAVEIERRDETISRLAKGLTLEVGDELVVIEGPVQVVVGSRELLPERHLRKVNKNIVGQWTTTYLAASNPSSTIVRTLERGDKVRVCGHLERVSAKEEHGGYREAETQWVLSGDKSEGGKELLLASEDAPHVVLGRPKRPIQWALFGAALGLVGLWSAGKMFISTARDEVVYVEALLCREEQDLPTARLAAATPFHREEAIGMLRRSLGYERCFNRSQLERAVALDLERGVCPARMLVHHNELERAAEVGLQCDDDWGVENAIVAFFGLGRFEEASRIQREEVVCIPEGFEAELHLLGGQPKQAASRLKRCVSLLESARQSDIEKQPDNLDKAAREMAERSEGRRRRELKTLECVADAILAQGGDSEALDRLEKASVNPDGRWCRPLYADLLKGDARLRALEQPAVTRESERVDLMSQWFEALLIAEVDSEATPPLPPARRLRTPIGYFYDNLRYQLDQVLTYGGLEHAVLTSLRELDDPSIHALRLRSKLAVHAAYLELVTGNHDAARGHVTTAEADINAIFETVEEEDVAASEANETGPAGAEGNEDEVDVEGEEEGEGEREGEGEGEGDPGDSNAQEGGTLGNEELRIILELAVLIEIDAGELTRARELIERLEGVPGGDGSRLASVVLDYRAHGDTRRTDIYFGEERLREAVDSGDGHAIAEALRGRGPMHSEDIRLWAPQVETGRETLAEAVRMERLEFVPCKRIWECLFEATQYHSVMVALGQQEWARAQEQRIERLRAAALRRDIAVPLLVLENL